MKNIKYVLFPFLLIVSAWYNFNIIFNFMYYILWNHVWFPDVMTSDIYKVWNITDNINGSKQYLFFIKNRLSVGCMFNLSAFTFTIGENVMCDIISNSNKWFSYKNSDHHAFVWPEFLFENLFLLLLIIYHIYIFIYSYSLNIYWRS